MLARPVVETDNTYAADHIVVLRGATWVDFQRMLEIKAERSIPRVSFSLGNLQLMSPSRSHEFIKFVIGRLVEVYCSVKQIEFSGYGGWTLERKHLDRGVEPDECYVFGTNPNAELPDLAIEVIWTSGGIDKLEIYRALGVKEVWLWRAGRLSAHILQNDRYVESSVSAILPGLDLDHLARFIDRPTASQSIREFRATL